MNIQAAKLEFIEQFMKLKDESIIDKLCKTLKKEVSKQKRLPLSTSEQQAIKKGLEDIKLGKVYTHDEVMSKMRKKYPDLVK